MCARVKVASGRLRSTSLGMSILPVPSTGPRALGLGQGWDPRPCLRGTGIHFVVFKAEFNEWCFPLALSLVSKVSTLQLIDGKDF